MIYLNNCKFFTFYIGHRRFHGDGARSCCRPWPDSVFHNSWTLVRCQDRSPGSSDTVLHHHTPVSHLQWQSTANYLPTFPSKCIWKREWCNYSTLFHKYISIRDNVFLSKCILDGREDLVTFFQYMTLRFLETSIQFYCLVVGMVTCCVKVVLESLLQLKVVVHAVEQKSVADLRMGVSSWTSGKVNEV